MTSKQMPSVSAPFTPQIRPWWKEPYVWMVICGPLSAVVPEDRYSEGVAIKKQVNGAQPPMQPAQIGRNHSATGGKKNESP
jgi:hypothetical protein